MVQKDHLRVLQESWRAKWDGSRILCYHGAFVSSALSILNFCKSGIFVVRAQHHIPHHEFTSTRALGDWWSLYIVWWTIMRLLTEPPVIVWSNYQCTVPQPPPSPSSPFLMSFQESRAVYLRHNQWGWVSKLDTLNNRANWYLIQVCLAWGPFYFAIWILHFAF